MSETPEQIAERIVGCYTSRDYVESEIVKAIRQEREAAFQSGKRELDSFIKAAHAEEDYQQYKHLYESSTVRVKALEAGLTRLFGLVESQDLVRNIEHDDNLVVFVKQAAVITGVLSHVKALLATPAQEAEAKACPHCKTILKPVTYHGGAMALNRDQWESVKAGDWYCENCKSDRSTSGYLYFWNHELATPQEKGKG